MSKAIIIASTRGREHWLNDCLHSLRGYDRYPIIVCTELGYELGKIRHIHETTDLDEFLFLQDSVIVKHYAWIDEAFDHPASVSLCDIDFFMYLGKYTRANLNKLSIPIPKNKKDAVMFENSWTSEYALTDRNLKHLFNDLHDTNNFEQRHGRLNMVLENEHLKKYKGTWHPNMIRDDD